jgi:hypothetical protein
MTRTVPSALLGAALLVVALGAGRASAYYPQSGATYDAAQAPTLLTTVSGCDDCSQVITLPFAFPFYGKSFTEVTVASNGYLVLGNTTASAFSNAPLAWEGTASAPAGMIAPLWDDWNPGAGGDIYAGWVGSAYVVEWRNLFRYGQSSGSGYTFKVKLFSNGTFELHYGNLLGGYPGSDNGGSATSGYQEGQNTTGHPLSHDQAILSSSTAKRFTRPGAVGLYVLTRDGLFNQLRPGLSYSLTYTCGGYTYAFAATSTNSAAQGGWAQAASTPACSQAPAVVSTSFTGDVAGYSVSTYPLAGGETKLTSGTYVFVKRADVTPRQTKQSAFTVTYADPTQPRRAVLDYWVSGAFDKPLLIVTGFDPLNEDSTANYLMLMGDVVRTLHNEGYDIAIGKHGDGNQRLGWFRGEVAAWIDDAVAQLPAGSKVQVAGISQGGIVLRDTLHNNVNGVLGKVKAWYSIDSPQLGANLGRGYRGIQTLTLCHKPETDPGRRKLTSAAAHDLVYSMATTCSCDNEPENSTCGTSSAFHDAYYGAIGWPTSAIPRYALAFSDANPNNGFNKMGSDSRLFDFYYSGWFCSEDRDWEPGQRDCVAGSRSITTDMVNTDQGASLCGTFRLRLQFEPAFINADSALAVTGNALSTEAANSSCTVNYSTLSPTQWKDWASNDYNEKHEVLTSALANKLLTWVRAEQ